VTGGPPLTFAELAGYPVTALSGLGPKAAEALAEIDVTSVLDLLTLYPRRYLDRTREATIAELTEGEEGSVLVEVTGVDKRTTRNRRSMVVAAVRDPAGPGRMKLTFFNQPWRARQLRVGMQAVVFGRLERYRGAPQMTNPVVDVVGDGSESAQKTRRIIAVYPQSEKVGLVTWDIARWVQSALSKAWPRGLADPVPGEVLARLGLVDRGRAFWGIHLPEQMRDATEARRRLVFDELLRVQLELVRRKRRLEAETAGLAHRTGGPLVSGFLAQLPFPLTGAQRRTIAEIDDDLARAAPMHRLLQGDVGSGKTVVAVHTLLVAVQSGHQGAFMAPTEVLAEQHALAVRVLLGGLEVTDDENLFGGRELRVELLTNRVTGKARQRLLEDLAGGRVDLLIGTHALLGEGVRFASLGAVVIDEQHRFGVEQRAALSAERHGGAVPDVLVMTATPIPRTAAMTVYGDLDVSVLDELPPGRTPVDTVWARSEPEVDSVWERVRHEIAAGRQAYVVCPLVEESEKLEVSSAERTHAELTAPGGELSGLAVGLLHGRVAPADKERVMAGFREGSLDVLVATTVIEVGVDVPNATVMVVLDADRFGIAQLHQLRGRVGRGEHASVCFLVGEGATAEGEARLGALVGTTDGFALAEVDLELRGEGTLMGERQKGRNDLKLASLRRDVETVVTARQVAAELLDADPTLSHHVELADEIALVLGDEAAGEFLLKS
jgi:ATP-dependent DNA helicase RecG